MFCILDVHQIPLKPESVGVQQKLTKKEIISPEKVFMDSVRAIVPSISQHHFQVTYTFSQFLFVQMISLLQAKLSFPFRGVPFRGVPFLVFPFFWFFPFKFFPFGFFPFGFFPFRVFPFLFFLFRVFPFQVFPFWVFL